MTAAIPSRLAILAAAVTLLVALLKLLQFLVTRPARNTASKCPVAALARLAPFRKRGGGVMSATRPAQLTQLAAALTVLALAGVLFVLYVHPAYAQDGSAPAKPTGLSATASHDQVVLTWDDPGDDSITGYVILRRIRVNDTGGEFSVLVADTGTAATTYTDGTVAASTTYTYRIKAINEYGVSERSRWFHIDTPAAPEAVEGDEQGGEDGGGAPGHATPPGPGGRANVSEGDGEDLPADTTTTGEVEVGGSVTGNITSASDRDWFRVDLKKDKRYQIDLEGADTNRGTLTDPLLNAMRDASNNSVAGTWNDDGGVGINARTIFTAPADGAHYVVAAGNGATGTYTLSVILLGANGASEADTDFPATTATTGRVDVGASATGNRGSIGDADWFRVDLEVGKTYQIDLTGEYGGGGTLKDPYLDNIRDSSGTQISNTFNGDVDFANDNLDSQIIFTPTAAGTYYLVAFANGSITGTYTLSVRDITPAANNAPVFDPATATREVAENSAAGTDVGDPIPEATDADTGDMLTYSMEGTDAASFSFDASTRQITTISGVDYNHEATQNSYSVTVKVSDGTDSATIAVTIDVTDVNEKSAKPDKPTLAAVTGSSTSLTATWTKPDLNGGPAIADYDVAYRERPSGNWEDSGITGAVLTTTITGLKADTSYQVRVRASNNEAISDWSDLSDVVKTNAEAVTPTLSVADAAATEGDEVTFTVTLSPAATEDVTATWTASIGSDDTAVAADLGSTTTGTLTFTAGDTEERFTVATAEDELHEDNETFTVTLSSPSSNATLATDPPATGTITDDDAPPTLSVDDATASEGRDVAFTVRLSPASGRRVTATWTASIESGDTAVAAATASDRVTESAETFTLTLSRPENAELADATGQGTINAAVLPNTAPVITTTSPVAVAENGTAVATLAASDADGDPIAWSKTGGADADRFALSAEGVLTFNAEPDYESPADVASADPTNDAENNEYVVFVTASDGTDAAELQLVVRVTNANDAPTGTVTIDDTSPMIGDVLTASAAAVADQDGLPDPFAPAWQWYRTPMGGSETEIDRATAATYTVVRADYGATLTAKATWTDVGGFTNTLASAATDETPRPSCTQNPGDVWCGVVTVEWYEPLSGDGYAPAFDSDPQVGDLSNKNFAFRGMPYTIDLILVERKTGDSFFEGVYFSLDRALPRNARDALVLYIGPTSRPPSTPSGDTSLSFQPFSRVDYASNTYTYRWLGDKRSEGGGPGDPGFVDHGPGVDWSNQTTVTVRLRENAPPVFMSAGPFTVDENETTVGTVTATDADPGDTYLRYAITGGADRYESDGTTERFEIDAESGALSFKSAPNYEDPQDDGADNVYEVEVEARSGMDTKATAERGITNRTTQPIMVTVADVPEQPAKPAKPTLAAVADSTTSLRVSWTKPDLNGGPEITGYDLQYREYATGTDGEWTALEDIGTAVTAIITGLSADTEYEARVQAENGELPSDWSEPSDPFSPKSCALNPGDLWCGVVTVEEAIAAGGTTTHGFLELLGAGDLDGNPEDKMFRGYTIGGATVTVGGALGVVLDRDLSDADWATLALHVDDHSEPFAFSTASTEAGVGTYTWDGAGLDWSSASPVTLRLRETDPPMLSVAPASATEGEAVAFTVTLSPATGRQVTVDWERSIGSGDTAETEDFADLSAATGTLTFAAKVTGQTITVATAQDTDEDDETFTVTLSNQSPSVVGLANATATGTIRDDGGLPKVTIMAAEDTVTEGTDAVFTLSRTGSTAAALPVSVAVTQQADRDLLPDGAAANRTVTFAVDAATAALTVELEDDTLRELAGDLTVEVQAGTGYTVGNPSRAVVDVRDGDRGAPLTPQGLTAAPGAAAGEVVLTWTAPAPHLAYDLHQYRYKTDGADGSWTDIPDSGRDDAREGANLARYTVTGLAGGQEHTFQVRARISYDTPSVNVFSAASNEAKATPPVPAVTLHLTDSSANAVGNGTVLENRGTITVTATVAPASATPFTVTVTASPVAPATDADFTLSADPVLSFAAGATASTGTVTIGVVDDDVPEPRDVVTVSGAVSDPAVTAPEDVTLTIANDDVDVPFDITVAAPAAVAEDAGTASVRVTLTTQENEAPTIGTEVFFYRGGTAEDGADYTSPVMGALVTTLAVSAFSQNDDGTAWVAQTMFTIGIVDDGLDEADETIVFRIATQNDEAPDQTITITDDDAPPSVSFGAASYAVDEGGSVEVAVVLSAPSGRERVEVPLAHEGEGGAALSDDYSGVPAEVTFAAGETERKFTIEAPADAYAETGEGVALSFGTLPDGATAGSVREATVSLNDVAVTVSFEQAAYTAAEGGAAVTVTLTLDPPVSHVLRVTMVAQHGEGATAADYRGIEDGRDALFTAGQTRSHFDVTAVDDALDEADETVTLGFTFAASDTGLTAGSVAEATLTLTDNDDPPGVEDVMAASAVEGEPVQFAVTLTEASGRTVNLGWEVRVDGASAAAADFDPFPQDGVLTFAPGDTTRTITVATAEDTADEEDETFEVRITPDGNVDLAGSLTVTGTIEDDDREPGLSVEDASAVEGEPVQFAVTLTEASGKRVTVDWRASAEPGDTAGTGDFTAANGTLTFTAGQRSKTVGVATARDDIEEEDESFTLTLSNPTNATLSTDRTATGTIDGDPLVLSVAPGSAVEGNEVRFTATLSVASTQDVTVDWEVWLDDRSDTAEPEDFADLTAEHGTLTIAAGQTTGTVRVGTAADTLPFETSESFTLLLSNPVNATVADPTVRGTIVNRPPPAARTAFTALPSSNTEVVLAWEAATRESVVQAGVPSNTYVPLFIEMSLNAEITRHEYRYKTVGGAYPATWTAIADSASGGANAYGYTVAGLSNETVYKFQLRTVGVGGNGRPVTSNAVTPTPGICDRTPQVRDAIVAEVPGVADCAHVKLAHLAAIRRLDDHGVGTIEKGIESLRVNDFAGLTNLDTLNLGVNELTELPTGVFAGLTNLVTLHLSDNRLTEVHAGEFAGLTKLTNFSVADNQLTEIPGDLFAGQPYMASIRIRNNRLSTLPDGLFAGRASPGLLFVDGNTVDPLPLTVTLEPVGLDQVRAKVPAGAPFEMRLPVTVTDGALADGLTTLTVAAGSVESTPVTVYRAAGTGGAVTVDLGTPLPSPPELHWGYVLTPAASGLPVTVPAAQIAPAAPVEENTTAVRTLRASDGGGGTVTWSKTGGADAARFALTAAGVLTFVSAPDYEAPADVASADPRNDAANNEYVVFVTPSDGTELRLVVRVTNVNEAPTAGTVTIDDMTPAVGVTLTATVAGLVDPDGLPEPFTTLSWQWYRTPTDGSETVIPGAIGATYTAAAADLGATLTAKATYTDGGGFDNTLASDSTAAVLRNTAPVITTTSPVAVAENGTAVATLAATDADRNPIAWSKTGGADADRFALSAQGVLTFKAEPDYESPADVASIDPANDAENNEYVVFVTASDGTDDTELQLVVRVTNANDAPTGTVTIDDTSPMIGDVLTASAAAVADQDGLPDPFAPAWQWYRTPMGGSETEIDRATAATYTVVRADYGATLTAKATWTDVGGFTNTLASAATDETPRPSCTQNPGDVWCGVVTVEWYEPLSGDGYAPAFDSDPQVGDLSNKNFAFRGMPYTIDLILVERKTGDSFFEGVYFSLDRALPRNARDALVLYIGPTSRPPSTPSGDTSLSFQPFSRVDYASNTYTYRWLGDKRSEGGGPGDPGFVDHGPGVDWSNQTTVTVRLRENAPPVFMSAGPFTVDENETTVGTVTATDADPGDTYLRYAITGGADRYESDGTTERFEIDAESGALSFKSAPNYEDPQDDGADNVYEVEVEARSGMDTKATAERGITNRTTQPIMVTVADVPEQPAKPAKPTLAAVADSTTSLRVSWTKPDLNGGPEITGYDLQYREGTTGNWQDFAHTGTAVTTTITGLTADTSYQVQVRAKNGETDSDWSDPSDAVSTNAATPGTTPTLIIADAAASEGSNVTFTVTLSEADAADVTATWTASVETGDTAVAADLGATKTGTVTVSAGDTTGTFTVPTVEDTTVEANETFTVTLTGPSSNAVLGTATAAGTIDNDDLATVSVADVSAAEGTADDEGLTFTVTLSEAVPENMSVAWTASIESGDSAAAADLTGDKSGTVTIDKGSTTGTFTVETADTTDENDQTFTVTLSNPTPTSLVQLAADPTATGTIEDDDPTPTVTVGDGTATEGDAVEFVVTLSAVSGRDVTVDYATSVATGDTATSGTDFTAASGTLTIAAADATATGTIEVPTTEDDATESAETFTLTLSDPKNATLTTDTTATGTINNRATAAAKPTNFTAGVGDTKAVLSWDAPASDSGVTRHEYRFKTGTGSYPAMWEQIADSGVGGANQAGFTVPNLTNEVLHTFQLRAVNAQGESAAAEADPVTPTPGICGRTQQVQDGILAAVTGVDECAAVTVADLAGIDFLDLANKGITSLQAGDFGGLTAVETLDLKLNPLLTTLPSGVFSGLTAILDLNLRENGLATLPENVFSGLPTLVVLDLYNNELATLPAGLFSGLAALRDLTLDDNDLTSLPDGLFSGLTRLDKLELDDNPDTGDTLPLTVTLEKVGTDQVLAKVLAGAPFDVDVPVTPASGTLAGDVTALRVATGSVESAAVTVTRTEGTTAAVTVDVDLSTQPTLPLRHAGYFFARAATGLPAEILPEEASLEPPTGLRATPGDRQAVLTWTPPAPDSGFTRHEYRFKEGTGSYPPNWTPIPDSGVGGANQAGFTVTAGLTNETAYTFELRAVSADGESRAAEAGPVTPTPGICGRTPQVRDDILDSLSGVDDCAAVTVADLATVTEISIVRGNVTALKSGDFAGLSALEELHLNDNPLSTLPPDVFSGLSALKVLNLAENALSSLPPGVFSGLSALEELALSGNTGLGPQLTGSSFSGLTSLRILLLNGTDLGTVPAGLFSGLPELREIHLSRNGIEALPASVFSGLTKLETIVLANNSLRTLPDGVFAGLTDLEILILRNNPVTLRLTVTLETVAGGQVRAKVLAGAPSDLTLRVRVENGVLSRGAETLQVAKGSVAGAPAQVIRTGDGGEVTVDLVTPLPSPPSAHSGYEYVRAASGLPVEVADALEREPGVEGQLRLVDRNGNVVAFNDDATATSPAEGRLEVFHAGRWGTVCNDRFERGESVNNPDPDNTQDDEWENAAPRLACLVMGYEDGRYDGGYGQPGLPSQPLDDDEMLPHWSAEDTYPPGYPVPIWLDDVTFALKKVGEDTYLTDQELDDWLRVLAHERCSYTGWGLHNCVHAEDAGLSCWNGDGDSPPEADAAGAVEPLTARFEARPAGHDGERPFAFRLAFSEDVTVSAADMRGHALAVTGGRVADAVRVDGRGDLWSLTVAPSGAENVEIALSPGRECKEAGAICTQDGRQLSRGLAVIIPVLPPLTVWFEDAPGSHDGESAFTLKIAFSEDVDARGGELRNHVLAVSGGRKLSVGRADGRKDLYEAAIRPKGDGDVTIITWLNSDPECGTAGTVCTADGRALSNSVTLVVPGPESAASGQQEPPQQEPAEGENRPATGAPAITGTAQVGETLTADPSGIADEDGLDNVAFAYQWLGDDTDIAGATNATYTLADADRGKAIGVRVSFTDDAGNEDTLTSAATDAVAGAEPAEPPGKPTGLSAAEVSHDRVTLTWDDPGDSSITGYVILRRRHDTHAQGQFSTLAADTGTAATTYTDASVAAETPYTYRIKAINEQGMSERSRWFHIDTPAAPEPPEPVNSPATGAPAISGTVQVGEELTAGTSGIADEDGLENVTFGYQWLADDSDIAGAAASTYTLADTDEGKTVKVRVSFADDAGNDEALTSVATAEVEGRPNYPATGAPRISGTVQVGETLAADTTGIADEDSLENATFSYQWLAEESDISGATARTYTLSNSDEGKAIKVKVSFTDDAGNDEELTSVATVAVAAAEPSEPPAKPTGLSATATHDRVVLTWDDPGDDSITGYVILRRVRENDVGGEFTPLVADTGTAATTYTDDSVKADTTYTYRIKAINGYGVSERSRWFHIDTPAAPEPAGSPEK